MEWTDLISKVLVGSISGLVVAYFTAKYALGRFYREKWWDRRITLYIQLVESIYSIKKASIYWNEEQQSMRSGFSELSLNLNEEEKKDLAKEHDAATNELRKISDLSPLLLNDECKRLIDIYLERQANLQNQWHYDEIELDDAVGESLNSVITLLNSIILEARKELRSDHKSFKETIDSSIKWIRVKFPKK